VLCHESSFGGSCVSAKTVAERMKAQPASYELLELNITYDRSSFAYKDQLYLQLRCLRLANRTLWYQAQTFGRVCAARGDLASLPANLPPHPWDAWVPILEAEDERVPSAWPIGLGIEESVVEAQYGSAEAPAIWEPEGAVEPKDGVDRTEL
jgi:hypothetical protein